jgi:uncharacterized protein GlcG (DUF336 family)
MRNTSVSGYSEARKIIEVIVEKASQMQKAIAIAVVDAHGGGSQFRVVTSFLAVFASREIALVF